VLLDQRMTTMDGVETLLALRERGLGTAMSICLMTSADSPLLITDALRAGARFCFTKPLEFAQLKLHLSEIARFFSEVAVLPRTEAGGRNGDEST
ncbi:MAG: response regulator, partial [Myxococcota bacterium]